MSRLTFLAIAFVFMLAAMASTASAQWRDGRATFYGKDGWSIHQGSCGYGYLDENVGTGWDVAAASDANWDYKGSCGKCKEVRCKRSDFKDGYGQRLDRANVCHDPDASIVVMIVDTCPCSYPGNWYSNKRWCCGDMYHMDLSIWAMEKLTDIKWGVIALEWRDVACNYKPNKVARNPSGFKSGADVSPPWNWKPAQDKRPNSYWQGRKLRGNGGAKL